MISILYKCGVAIRRNVLLFCKTTVAQILKKDYQLKLIDCFAIVASFFTCCFYGFMAEGTKEAFIKVVTIHFKRLLAKID